MDTDVEALHNLLSKIASYFADAQPGRDHAAGFAQAGADNDLNILIARVRSVKPMSDS